MKKKIFLTESEKKAIILEREKAIVESFAKTFNKIKRVDENEINQETSLEKTGEIVANKIQQVLSPEEINFLKQAYTKGGKELIAKTIASATDNSANEGAEPPAEGDMGMSRNEIKLRQIIEKIIASGSLGGLVGIIPAAMAGYPALAAGLGISAMVGFLFKDAAWWKSKGHHYNAQKKYGLQENGLNEKNDPLDYYDDSDYDNHRMPDDDYFFDGGEHSQVTNSFDVNDIDVDQVLPSDRIYIVTIHKADGNLELVVIADSEDEAKNKVNEFGWKKNRSEVRKPNFFAKIKEIDYNMFKQSEYSKRGYYHVLK